MIQAPLTAHLTVLVATLFPILGSVNQDQASQGSREPGRVLQTRARPTPARGEDFRSDLPDRPDHLRVLDQPLVPLIGPAPEAVMASLDGEHRGAVVIDVPSSFRVLVSLPQQARLSFGLDHHGSPQSARLLDYQVGVVQDGGVDTLFRRSRACFESGWSQHQVDLSAYEGQEVLLEFAVRSHGASGSLVGTQALWSEPVVDGATSAPDRPDVLLVVIDSLRADALGCYGSERGRTPTMDGLAEDGVVLERVMSTAPWAVPATLTLLTGRHPSDLWPADWYDRRAALRLRPRVPTLAGVLRGHGYYTVGISDHAFLVGSRFGRGFDQYVDLRASSRSRRLPSLPHRLWHRLRATLTDLPGTGLFTYVHLVFPSEPHRPPDPYRERSSQPAPNATRAEEVAGQQRALYDAEVRYTDDWVRLLLELFEELDRRPDIVLLVGSHGLGFGEHQGRTGAGHSLYNEQLHVPWILHAPGRVEAGRCASLVSTVDLVPTVLDLVGIEGGGFAGRSVGPLLRGEESDQRLAFSEFPLAPSPSGRAIQSADWKLILPNRENATSQVFRVEFDAAEQAPLDQDLEETKAVKERLWDEILSRVRASARHRQALPSNRSPDETDH